jgi:signal transduction histidine kinase
MFLSGLKVQIATTLMVLLTLGILLGNLVIVAFWQKGLVRREIEFVRLVCGNVLPTNNNVLDPDRLNSNDDFKNFCAYVGKTCVGVIFSKGGGWLNANEAELQTSIHSVAQESADSQKEILRMVNSAWGSFSFDKRYLLIGEPLLNSPNRKGEAIVVVLELDSIYESIFKHHKAILVYWLVNVILLTVVGFFRLIKITVKPVERMVKRSELYHGSDVLFFENEEKRSEFGQLSMALNSMLCRIESDRGKLKETVLSLEAANMQLVKNQKEMVRTEKIASVGVLSAGLAHEIGNPIGIVQGYVELLQQADLTELDRCQFAKRALNELDRINRLIRQLLDYAKSSPHDMSSVNLRQLVEEVCQIVSLKKHSPQIVVSVNIQADIYIQCDRENLLQVFLNCLLNAFDAIESKGVDFERQVSISAEKIFENEGGLVDILISIKDTGTGVEEKDLEVIFEPFFTKKDPGKGTGLGLFVSHSIIDSHGGKIWMESTFGQGSTIYIRLPQSTSSSKKERNETSDH